MTSPRPTLRPLDPAADAAIRAWLDGYISHPHEDLGRDGPVCPYVPQAVRHRLVACVGRTWTFGESDDRGAITDLIVDAISEFRTRAWPDEHPELRAVVAAIPNLPRDRWPLLDTVQQSVKGRVAESGLMLGPFHLDSRVTAAHNTDFHPNTAPIPLIVVRRMARHDLWFLHERADWFRAYQKRFAHAFDDRTNTSPLSELYHATADTFAHQLPSATARGAAR